MNATLSYTVDLSRLPDPREKIRIWGFILVIELSHLKSRINRINPVFHGRSVFPPALLISRCLSLETDTQFSSHHLPTQHTGTFSLLFWLSSQCDLLWVSTNLGFQRCKSIFFTGRVFHSPLTSTGEFKSVSFRWHGKKNSGGKYLLVSLSELTHH